VREGLAGAEDADVLDAGGEDAVAELEEKPRAGDDVHLDGAAAPGAAIDGGGGGGESLAVEIAAGDLVKVVAEGAFYVKSAFLKDQMGGEE